MYDMDYDQWIGCSLPFNIFSYVELLICFCLSIFVIILFSCRPTMTAGKMRLRSMRKGDKSVSSIKVRLSDYSIVRSNKQSPKTM